MKVIHVIWDLGLGGSQSYLSNLIRVLKSSHGLDIDVIVLTEPGVFSDQIKSYASRVAYIGMKSGFDILAAVRLYKKLRLYNADVIHVHTNTIVANVVYTISKTPVIYTEHGIGVRSNSVKEGISRFLLYHFFCYWVTCFIAVSKKMRNKMIALNSRNDYKITTIQNGIDLSVAQQNRQVLPPFQSGKVKGEYKICTVGRLTKIKDVHLFLRVARRIIDQNRDVSFYIIGDGDQRADLEMLADELKISEFVHFLGFRDDVSSLLQVFDLYIMTSHFESFGLTVIEAMASGVPVIAAKADWPSDEIINNHIDGILLENRDPELIADTVCDLLINKQKRDDMAKAAKTKVESRFTIERNAEAVNNCYLNARVKG